MAALNCGCGGQGNRLMGVSDFHVKGGVQMVKERLNLVRNTPEQKQVLKNRIS